MFCIVRQIAGIELFHADENRFGRARRRHHFTLDTISPEARLVAESILEKKTLDFKSL